MEKRRVKIIWGSSDRINGHWRLGLWGHYDRLPGLRDSGLAISVRGLLRWGATLGMVGYVMGASVLYYTFQRNPYNQVSYVDTLLLPLRWNHVREVRGRMLIEEGLADLKAQRWGEAGMKLRAGLSRAPHDVRARLELARFYAAANRRASALTLLTEDLDHGNPGRPYLEVLFALAGEGEEFDVIVATCDRFIAEPSDRAWLTVQKIVALLRSHRAAEVLALTEKMEAGSETSREAHVTALLELKRPAEALQELARWSGTPRPTLTTLRRLEVRAQREAGNLAEMDAAMESYRRLAPADPRVYGYLVVQQWLAGRKDAAAAALEDFFRRFSSSTPNLLIVLQGLAEAKAVALVQRCAEEGAAHGFAGRSFKVALVEAQLTAGDWRAAARTLEELGKLTTPREPKDAFVLEWATRLLAVASRPDEAPQAGLLEFFQQRRASVRVYRQSCEVLILAGRLATARQVLELAGRAYPSSQSLEALRIQVESALAAVPPPLVVESVAEAPAPRGEKEFFETIAVARREQRWPEAAAGIREVRVSKPQWLAGREADVLELQLRVASQMGDTLEMLSAAKLLLDGSGQRAVRLVALAREFGEAGNRPDGERLLQEVLRRNPDFPLAVRLRAEWQPKPAPEKAGDTVPVVAPKGTSWLDGQRGGVPDDRLRA